MSESISPAHEPFNRRRVNSLLTPWTHPLGDFFVAGAWFWATAHRFAFDAYVLYALTAYFMIGIYLHWPQVAPALLRGWPVLLLPLYAMWSFLWSAVPAESFKSALQLLLTVLICVYIGARVPQRAFIFAIFLALTYHMVMSLPLLPSQSPFAGVFADKNSLAQRMSILAFAAAAIVLDKQFAALYRWAAAPVLLIALVMILRSQSATSAIVGALGLLFIIAAAWVWRPARGYRVLIVALLVAALALVMMIVGQDPHFNLMDEILQKFGKDSTLTGRQELWDYARTLIQQKPWLGLGPGGFWLPERMDAQMLLDTHYKPRGTAFSFHNSYIELAVYLGLTGLALGLVGWVWSVGVNLWRVISAPTLATAFFGALTIVALARSYVESDLWRPNEFVQMIVWIGALSAVARRPAANILGAGASARATPA